MRKLIILSLLSRDVVCRSAHGRVDEAATSCLDLFPDELPRIGRSRCRRDVLYGFIRVAISVECDCGRNVMARGVGLRLRFDEGRFDELSGGAFERYTARVRARVSAFKMPRYSDMRGFYIADCGDYREVRCWLDRASEYISATRAMVAASRSMNLGDAQREAVRLLEDDADQLARQLDITML